MISGYISLKTIIASLYRNLDVNYELNEQSIVEWSAEALLIIGAYSQFNEVSDCITLTNGKAKLPCDFYKLVDIRYKNLPIYWSSNTNRSNYQCSGCQIPTCTDTKDNYSFYINDSYIITNILNHDDLEANLCMVYLAIPVDEEGYPLIPDDIYFNKAITSYITYMMDRIEWRKGKIADKIKDESEKEWLFYVNSARGSANMPNTAQLESLKNILQRLMPLTSEYKRGFKNIKKQENLNL